MCITWFGAAVLLSPSRMAKILTDYYRSGGIIVSPAIVGALTNAWLMATALVTAAFLGHLLYHRTRGHAQNPAKLVLMATSIAFWWYTNVVVTNMLVGIALFEIFHDVQYLDDRLDLQSQPGGSQSQRRPVHALPVPAKLGFSGSVCGSGRGVWIAESRSARALESDTQSEPDRTADRLGAAAFLLRRLHLEGARAVRRRIARCERSTRPADRAIRPSGWAHGLKWAAFILPVVWLGFAETRGVDAGARARSDDRSGRAAQRRSPEQSRRGAARSW